MKLAGRVAVITGGGSGIGEATAYALAEEGAHIVIAGRRQEVLDRVADRLRSQGLSARAVRTDVSDEGQVQHLVDSTLGAFDRLDILVNNAGVGGGSRRIQDTSTTTWDRVLAVNLRGPFLCTRAVLPAMLAQAGRGIEPPGIIVNISSESGKFGYAGSSAYTASKWGLLGFTQVLEAEVMDQGIRVVAICPGMVHTEMTDYAIDRAKSRMLSAADVAELIRWLCTASPNVRITEVMIRTMLNPWA